MSWGRNSDGQLGDGSTGDSLFPTRVHMPTTAGKVIRAAAGDCHSAAVTGTLFTGHTPRAIPFTHRAQLTVWTVSRACACCCRCAWLLCMLTPADAGGVYCWGSGAKGQLGSGTTLQHRSPVLVEALALDSVIDVSAFGDYTACVACA